MNWIESKKSSDITGTISASSGSGSRYQMADDFPLSFGPPGVDESDLLLCRACDALITPITPRAFTDGNPNIRQLFSPLKAAEQDYFRDTGLFPIMHVVAIRKEVAEANPGLPAEVLKMYSEAKQIAYANLASTTVLRTSLPWVSEEYEETRQLMGDDYWRYGVEANRKELEAVMRYTYEQGLVKQKIGFEEMFHNSMLDT
jgi:4,5-dihydroxyphthalate decarboxylase